MMCTILQLCLTRYIAENIVDWDLAYVNEMPVVWEFTAFLLLASIEIRNFLLVK